MVPTWTIEAGTEKWAREAHLACQVPTTELCIKSLLPSYALLGVVAQQDGHGAPSKQHEAQSGSEPVYCKSKGFTIILGPGLRGH